MMGGPRAASSAPLFDLRLIPAKSEGNTHYLPKTTWPWWWNSSFRAGDYYQPKTREIARRARRAEQDEQAAKLNYSGWCCAHLIG